MGVSQRCNAFEIDAKRETAGRQGDVATDLELGNWKYILPSA
jgi:hypothetical protein